MNTENAEGSTVLYYDYLNKLRILQEDTFYKNISSERINFAWLSRSSTDGLFKIAQVISLMEPYFGKPVEIYSKRRISWSGMLPRKDLSFDY